MPTPLRSPPSKRCVRALLAACAILSACASDSVAHDTDAGSQAADAGSQAADAGLRAQDSGSGQASFTTPGSPVSAPVTADTARFAALVASAESASKFDAAGLRAAYPVKFERALGYDPSKAEFLDRIAASALGLTPGEQTALGREGFVISQRRAFPNFVRGYAEIYSEHLPVYVSADALLETVHASYDSLLTDFEQTTIVPNLRAFLRGLRARLPGASADARLRADVDLYVAVALALLGDRDASGADVPVLPVGGASPERLRALTNQVRSAEGVASIALFGSARDEDFSQFKPRGHYETDPTLRSYFQAMMWLGRIDLRLLETQSDGTQLFRRDQYLAMLLLHELAAADAAHFTQIDDVLQTFVGKSDYMTLGEVSRLVAALGGADAARSASDQEVVDAIMKGDFGAQEIASHLMVNEGITKTLPLNRSFALFGQRYVVDSHVFSNTTYDRIEDRLMPSTMDVAFAALGNGAALSLVPDLDQVKELPGALGRMRSVVDGHSADFWHQSLYNEWLSALRALSPPADLSAANTPGLPAVARGESFNRRLLNTQLASWAELRHDTLLYAKQSYSGIPACEYPDAYVDPYPELYAALSRYATLGKQLVTNTQSQALSAARMMAYFDALARIAGALKDMAERELRGEPFTAEQLAFINDAVRIEKMSVVCASIDAPNGWLADLYYDDTKALESDPTIADVHTQPADASGNLVGKVLHVGTGYPRLMVTTVDTCKGPRAYAGVVFAYHERVTENFQRLSDSDWAESVKAIPRPADVPWLSNVLAQ
jgi:hypothetical protein